MKKNRSLATIAIAAMALTALSACNGNTNKNSNSLKGDAKDSVHASTANDAAVTDAEFSYALGVSAGQFVRESKINLDKDQYVKGLTESAEGKASMDIQQAQQKISMYMIAKRQKDSELELQRSQHFLDSVYKLPGVIRDSTGLAYKIIEPGKGAMPTDSSIVRISYAVKLRDGKQLDASKPGEPVDINLKQVIMGWRLGIPKLKEGAKAIIYVPSNLAYGPQGRSGIPGNAVLEFNVELVKILNPADLESSKDHPTHQSKKK